MFYYKIKTTTERCALSLHGELPIPGAGWSSPIVWGDRVFLTGATADQPMKQPSYGVDFSNEYIAELRAQGLPMEEILAKSDARDAEFPDEVVVSLMLYSLDLNSGEIVWERQLYQGNPAVGRHRKNTYTSATPVTDGELVFASFGHQGMMAVDFDGNLVWHNKIEDLSNYHGSAGSPVLYEDEVIIYQDHGGASFVAAFGKRTGDVVWRTKRDAGVGWGTPIVIDTGERDELIVSSQSRVRAYDPATGEELWTVRGNLRGVIPTPVVGHGLVFATSGRAGPTFAIRPGGEGDVTDSHVAWKTQRGSPFVPSPIVVGEYLFMINDMLSIVTNYEASTGRLVYQGRLGRSSREGFSASPVALDGKVFFTNDAGQTFVVEVGPEFILLHVNELNAQTLASPALVDGTWYFRTDSELIAIGK